MQLAICLQRLPCEFAETSCPCRCAVQDLPPAVHLHVLRGKAEGAQRQQAPEGCVRGLLPGFREEVRRKMTRWQAAAAAHSLAVHALCGECECIAQLSTKSGRAHCTAARLRCASPPKHVGAARPATEEVPKACTSALRHPRARSAYLAPSFTAWMASSPMACLTVRVRFPRYGCNVGADRSPSAR